MDATAWRLCLGWPWLFVVLGLMSAGSVTRAQTLSLTGGLEGMNTTSGTASAAQSFAVSGTGLTGAPVEVVPPAGYEVALNRDFSSATGTATLPLSLGNQSEIGTLVFVRLASTEAVGSLLSGNIVVRGGGATQRTLAIPSGTVEADIPGAPTLGTITPGRGTLSVAFAAPSDTGGVPILNYEYSVDDGATYFNPQPARTSSPLLITGLTPGTSYTIRLRALNSAGNGPASAAASGTPTANEAITFPTAPLVETIGSGADTFAIDFVTINDPGNPANQVNFPPGQTNFFGAVSNTFRMGKFEVSRGMVSAANSAGGLNLEMKPKYALTIANFDFETGGLGGDGARSDGPGVIPSGWQAVGAAPSGFNYGYYNPTSDQGYDSAVAGLPGTTGSMAGENVFYFGSATNGQGIQQTLAATFELNTDYTLTVARGTRNSTGNNTLRMMLFAGSTLLTTRDVAPEPTGSQGTFLDYSTTYRYNPADASLAGQALMIRFLEIDNPGNPQSEVDIDNVRLTLEGRAVSNRPATGLSWNMMARFVNWMNTNQGYSPAYKFSLQPGQANYNADANIVLWQPGDPGYNPANPFRNSNALYVLPSEDEWYKAAYYGGADKYWQYATAEDTEPTAVASGTNGAVYNQLANGPADVNLAGGPSYYGTVGQSGNVIEILESSSSRTNNSATNQRIKRGAGYMVTIARPGKNDFRFPGNDPVYSSDYDFFGFRVARYTQLPSAPAIVSITGGDRQLSVSFTPPALDGGDAIVNYEYSVDGGNNYKALVPARAASPLVIPGLSNGTTYPVRIRAVNVLGAGPFSGTVNGTPVAPPDFVIRGTLNHFSTSYGTASAVQSFTVSGNGLNGTAVTLRPPPGYELSLNSGFSGAVGTPSSPLSLDANATLADTTVFVRLAATTPGGSTYRGNLSLGGGGASTRSLAIPGGTVVPVSQAQVSGAVSSPVLPVGQRTTVVGTGGSGTGFYQYRIKGGSSSVATLNLAGGIIGSAVGSVELEVRRIGDTSYEDSDWVSAGTLSVVTPPGAPTLGTISAGDGQLSVEFLPPMDDGGSVITNYEYSLNGVDWIARSPVDTTSPLVITGLTNGTGYNVQIRAVNSAGSGTASNSGSGTPVTFPGAPTLGAITPGDGQLSVAFTAPTDDGGAEITNYEYRLDDGSWIAFSPADTTSPLVIDGLTNGTSYNVQIRAVNSVGAGTASESGTGTPVGPGIPSISVSGTLMSFTTSYGTNSAAQSFTVTGENLDDGIPVLVTPPDGYEVSLNEDFTVVGTHGSPLSLGTGATIASTTVYVRLAATNAVGSYGGNITVGGGGVSDQTIAIPGGTVNKATQTPLLASLDKPSLVVNEVGMVLVSGGNGSGLFEYRIKDGGTGVLSLDGSGSYLAVGVGTAEIEVRRLGDSTYEDSAWVSAGTVTVGKAAQSGVTGLLTSVSVEVGGLTSVVGSGGSGTGGYEYRVKDGGSSVVTVASDGTITAVGVGTAEIEVRRLGDSTYEDSAWVSAGTVTVTAPASTPPGAPTITSITAGDGQLSVEFLPPTDDGGSPITNYEYTTDNGLTWTPFNPTDTTSPLVITGLVNGTEYTVQIRAVNAVGEGPASTSSTGTPEVPATPPGPPTITSVTSGDGELSIVFTPPTEDGGSPITNYEYTTDNGLTWTPFSPTDTESPLVITGLANGTEYTVQIRAVNAVGEGPASNSGTGTPVASVIAANDSVNRDGVPGSMTSILIANLLANDTYLVSPTVTLPSGTTAQGGTVTIDNGWILYTSPTNLASSTSDSFTYQISDGLGGTATATVTLVAGDYSAVAVNIVSVIDAYAPSTGKYVTFAVTPNRSYRIYATSSLASPISWQDLGAGSVYGGGDLGTITLHDSGAGSQRFYKVEEYRQ